MKLGTYIVSGLIFLFAIAGVAYILVPTDYELVVFDIPITLPVAVWVLIPAFLLFIVSILHIAFYGTKSFLKFRKFQKDSKELKDAIYWSILKEPKKHIYSTSEMKSFANILDVSSINIKGTASILDDKLIKVTDMIKRVENGEYVDLRESGIDGYLSKENEILLLNNLNRLKAEPSFAKTILQRRDAYNPKLIKEAIEVAIREWDFDELSKFASLIDKSGFYKILDLVDDNKKANFSLENLRKFIDYKSFECKDFMRVAKSTVKRFSPDANLALFKEMIKNSPKAQSAYLYILFEYEMRDSIKRFFEEHDESDFRLFRAYEAIKASGQNIKIDEIINYQTACNES